MTVLSPAAGLDRARLADALVAAAIAAGQAILCHYSGPCAVMTKADASPVTAADHEAEAIILAALAIAAPAVPVVAEEEAAAGRVPETDGAFFLVDPLDGTKEFIKRRGDFTVNIALVEDGRPTLGVVYAPARGRLFVGDTAYGAWLAEVGGDGEVTGRRAARTRAAPDGGLVAVASQSHSNPETEAYLDRFAVAERVSRGSSLKFCLVAAGEADLYPRLAPTMEWDTAAGDAVLRAAGGMVWDLGGAPLGYGKPRFFNPGFVATGGAPPEPVS